jgi:hypothetical protein
MEVKRVHSLALNEFYEGKLEVQGLALFICHMTS